MVCSKIFSGDLPELTSDVIQYLKNDYKTLHSCILVNRLWCRLAIPLLWEDPFSESFSKNYHFIEIYLHKLNEDDKIKLNECGIIFPSSTLFNYPSFIKCLSTRNLISSIVKWIKKVELTRSIFSSLIKIFIENEANLHTFEFTSTSISNDCFNSAFKLIIQNPNFICNVKNIRIDINSHHLELQDLYKIINLLKNLKKISFHYSILDGFKIYNYLNTLNTIIFYKIHLKKLEAYFDEVFEQPNVLESIHLLYCYSLDDDIIQQIFNLTKPFKLKSLFLEGNSISQIKQLKLLLQKSGNYLENIGLESPDDNEYKLQLFKLIKIYCIKIKFISLLGFDDQSIYSTFNLIKNIQQSLNYLNINFCQFGSNQLNYKNKLSSITLQNLGQILPYRLEYLSLALQFNINDLEIFFKNSQNIFIKKLLIRNDIYYEGEDILPCIKKYIMKEKKVSYLAIESLSDSEREDLFYLKDEVEEFKFYGIQVTNYDNLWIQVCNFINELY